MKRWILVGFVICALLVVWSLDYQSQLRDDDVGEAATQQEQLCHDIIVGNGTTFLLDRCEGNTWRYDSGYDSDTRDFTNDPSWQAMTKQ